MDQLGPIILRCGVVEETAEERDEVRGKAPGGEGRSHDHHDIDCGQFAAPQVGTGEQTSQRIDQEGEQEEEKKSDPGGKVGGQG